MKVKLPPGLAPELVQTPFALQLNVFAGDVARVHAPAPVQVQVASSRLHAPLLDPYVTALLTSTYAPSIFSFYKNYFVFLLYTMPCFKVSILHL